MPEQIGNGKYCDECGRERYYAKGLCGACYMRARRGTSAPVPLTEDQRKAGRQASQRAYYARHREVVSGRKRTAMRERYQSDPESAREKQRQWRAENPEKSKGYRAAYYALHGAEVRERAVQWRRDNRAKVRERNRRREALLRGAFVTPVSVSAIVERDRGICGICHKPVAIDEVSMDHIIPISRGGSHEESNIQLAHIRCNIRRNNRGPAQTRLRME